MFLHSGEGAIIVDETWSKVDHLPVKLVGTVGNYRIVVITWNVGGNGRKITADVIKKLLDKELRDPLVISREGRQIGTVLEALL